MPQEITEDSLFDGKLLCLQNGTGYRFSLDAVLLAHFVRPKPADTVLDLGAGCGVISLVLCYRWQGLQVAALEIQDSLFALLQKNVSFNTMQERITPQHGDLRRIKDFFSPEAFDLVVSNPPYGKFLAGRQNSVDEQAVARHEIKAGLEDVINAASFVLKNRGRAAFVYPASRLAVLIAALKKKKLEPKKLQIVYSYPGSEGKIVLVEAVKNGGEELQILPPFFVYEKQNGDYSPEMSCLYRDEPCC